MALEQTIQIVQMAYPQVYLACHTRHQRKRTSSHRLSQRDSAILSHLSEKAPMISARLASHLSISRSTLSEALKRLTQLGYVEKALRPKSGVLLTSRGALAIAETSVLEEARLRGVLGRLTATERRAVERGLNILAKAARSWSATQPKPDGVESFE